MTIHITGMEYGYSLPNWQIGDIVADADSGEVSRIVADGRKGASFWPVGNVYRPASNETAREVFDTVAAKLGALVPRCN